MWGHIPCAPKALQPKHAAPAWYAAMSDLDTFHVWKLFSPCATNTQRSRPLQTTDGSGTHSVSQSWHTAEEISLWLVGMYMATSAFNFSRLAFILAWTWYPVFVPFVLFFFKHVQVDFTLSVRASAWALSQTLSETYVCVMVQLYSKVWKYTACLGVPQKTKTGNIPSPWKVALTFYKYGRDSQCVFFSLQESGLITYTPLSLDTTIQSRYVPSTMLYTHQKKNTPHTPNAMTLSILPIAPMTLWRQPVALKVSWRMNIESQADTFGVWNAFSCRNKKPTRSNLKGSKMIHVPPCQPLPSFLNKPRPRSILQSWTAPAPPFLGETLCTAYLLPAQHWNVARPLLKMLVPPWPSLSTTGDKERPTRGPSSTSAATDDC